MEWKSVIAALKLAVCIDRNTAVMENCTIELRRIRD